MDVAAADVDVAAADPAAAVAVGPAAVADVADAALAVELAAVLAADHAVAAAGCGGGRKRRALQALKIKHFEKIAREQKAIEAASNEEQQQAQGEYQEGPQEQSQIADNQEQQSVEKLSESEEAKPNYMRTATIVGPIAQTATGFVVNVPQQPNIYGYY